ncbi:helix-turn-helix domain-containing protein [Nocardia sp. NBC_01388]|uniref:helix-turn-helix domain-containing protein n=1 Tax=Nocardia sp. NBC_01388 TaxID=2903596 RepID=UPI003246539C
MGIIAERISPADAQVDDVLAIRAARDQIPGALPTLTAFSEHDSLRAGAALYLHHSTLQARIPRLATVLGYRPDTALGRHRLHIALALNRITSTGYCPSAPRRGRQGQL